MATQQQQAIAFIPYKRWYGFVAHFAQLKSLSVPTLICFCLFQKCQFIGEKLSCTRAEVCVDMRVSGVYNIILSYQI